MITAQVYGELNRIVTMKRIEAQKKGMQLQEIHIGYIHRDLEDEYIRSVKNKEKFVLCEINGVPVIMNHLVIKEEVKAVPIDNPPDTTISHKRKYGW